MADQQTMQIHPVAAMRAAGKRVDMLEGFYPNQVKILEQEKFTLEQRVAELEATLKERDDDIAYALSKNAQAFQRHSPE
jgi:dGTP triphosphohydrolase